MDYESDNAFKFNNLHTSLVYIILAYIFTFDGYKSISYTLAFLASHLYMDVSRFIILFLIIFPRNGNHTHSLKHIPKQTMHVNNKVKQYL